MSNSWTILTQEETVAETLRPLAEETEHHDDSKASTSENTGSGAEGRPGEDAVSAVEELPVGDHQASEENSAVLSGDTSPGLAHDPTFSGTPVGEVPPPSSLDVPTHPFHDSDAHSQSEGLPEGPAQLSPDPDSFSDSYTHISPSPDEPSDSLTLGGVELTQEEDRLAQEGPLQPLNGEDLGQEGEEFELSQRVTDFGKQADYPVEPEGEPEVRRRRSLLAALEQIGRTEEEEEGEEEFQLPQREEESGFSVNKCILGAVILLGLGTIFFSESDYGARELRDAEEPVKQEWLNPEVPQPPVDVDSAEILSKLAKGKQQIDVLQAQLQAQQDELKVAMGQAAEGVKERLLREAVERENGRLKKEMASLPVLQKDNQRMKRELESVPALQRELETLRAAVTELKLSTVNEAALPLETPPSGQEGNSKQGTAGTTEGHAKIPWEGEKVEDKKKKEKYDTGEKKDWKDRSKMWKEGEKKERKEGGRTEWKEKEWKKGKYEQERGKEDKGWKQKEERKEWKERGDRKKETGSRGDEGKPWKDREGKKERAEKNDRKDWKEEKEWKKGKHDKWNDGKEWRSKEEKKERKAGKEHGDRHRGQEEGKQGKEWKKGKDGYKESSKDWKEKSEKRDWKEKGEKKEWKTNGERNDRGNERQGEDERKPSGKKERSKEGEWKRDGWKDGDRRKDVHKRKDEHKHKQHDGHRHHQDDRKEHLWDGPGDGKTPRSHGRPSLDRPDYWVHQRERLRRNPSPTHRCDSPETCARAEGLLPVPLSDFQAVLRGYLAKAGEAGADASKREELARLANEFFKDGVFVHDQMSFQEFAEDVGDILEDMVEGDEEEEEEDDTIEEEMDGFEREVMKKFSVQGTGEREERKKGEWKKESGRGRG